MKADPRLLAVTRAMLWRVAWFVATLAGVLAFVLGLMVLAPGDPIDLLPNASEVRPALEAEWGLNQPFWQRYLHYVARVLQGDLGLSVAYRPGSTVGAIVWWPAISTGVRIACALALTMGLGTGLAWVTAGRRSVSRVVTQWVSITPLFLLAHIAVHSINETTFALVQSGWIDRPDWFALPDQASLVRSLLAVVLLAVASGALAEVHAAAEDRILALRAAPFVDAARARGQSETPIVLRNLAPSLATWFASRAAFFVGGAVVLEKVLMLNGAGSILWSAAELRDYDLAMGISLLAAGYVASARLLADGVRLWLDPRAVEQL